MQGLRLSLAALATAAGLGMIAPAAAQTLQILSAEGDPASVAAMDFVIAEFQKDHPGVTVEYQTITWTEIGQKIVSSSAAGNPPDIVHLDDFASSVLSGQGLLEPLDDVIDRIGRDDYFPVPLEAVTFDGKVWGVPFANGFNLLWYRKDLYEAAGLEAPTTWDELLHNVQTLDGLTDAGGRIYGIALALNTQNHASDTVQAFMWSNGASIMDAEGNLALDTPEAIAAYEFEKQLFAYAPPGAAQYGNLEVLNAFATGRVAHSIYPARMVGQVLRTNPELSDKVGVVVVPKGTSDKARYASTLFTKAWGIPAGARNMDLAKDFLVFLETGEREIRWLHSVPVHFWPPRRSTAESEAYNNDPSISTGIAQAAAKTIIEQALPNGVPQLAEVGVVQPDSFKVLQAHVLSKMMQKMVLGGYSTESAVGEAVDEAKSLFE